MDTAGKIISHIIKNRCMKTVFQPIVSLRDGNILGYEALTRITYSDIELTTEEMFVIAQKYNMLWDIEYTSRSIALETAYKKIFTTGRDVKLFINVSPVVIQDTRFKSGFTKSMSDNLHIREDNIIFEITEKSTPDNIYSFKKSINHYKQQGFMIAIDDMGAGYSGLNLISEVSPQYIKLDMHLARGIAEDRLKQALVKGFIEFSNISNVMLIAEGIETQDELETLINLGVQYGQGYYIQRPDEDIYAINGIFLNILKDINIRKNHIHARDISDIYIRNLCKHIHIAASGDKVKDLHAMYAHHAEFSGLCVLSNGVPVGTLTRERLYQAVGGAFGFSLNGEKLVAEIMDKDFLVVDERQTIDLVSGAAMSRPRNKLYDFVVVVSEKRYLGVVTVKDLLLKTTEIEVSFARHQNPLSGLPGNFIIERHLAETLALQSKFSVAYIDLDNFKAYNDVYGFENGDCVLKLFADLLKELISDDCFIGHIGGDDFIAVVRGHITEEFFADTVERFQTEVRYFYTQADIKNGYITACGRSESETHFPLISATCVVANNKGRTYKDVHEVGEHLAGFKRTEKARKRYEYLQGEQSDSCRAVL